MTRLSLGLVVLCGGLIYLYLLFGSLGAWVNWVALGK